MALKGSLRVPSDKSISHRALLFASMAHGTSHLENLLPSDDVLSTIGAVKALGAVVELEEGAHGLSGRVTGWGERGCDLGPHEIYCGNSGTTTRLLLGLLSGLGADARLTGDTSLSKRPMERVMKPLRSMGARFECEGGHLPIRVVPAEGVASGDIKTEQASAQVKSAILLAGLYAGGTTSVTEPAKSRNHTELLLPAFDVPVEVEGLTARVTGPASLAAHDMGVPGDPSSAAFVAVAAACTPGSDVTIEEVALNPTRTGALVALERMGCDIAYLNRRMEGAEPVGDVHVRYTSSLRPVRMEPGEIPTLVDEVPVLALACCFAKGESVFAGAGELRVKESDRFAATIELLEKLGVEAWGEGDDLHICGRGATWQMPRGSARYATRGDHRLAMTAHLAALTTGRSIDIDDASCVSVSWPRFFDDISSLLA